MNNKNRQSIYKELFTLWQYKSIAPLRYSNYTILQKYAKYLGCIPAVEFVTSSKYNKQTLQRAAERAIEFLDKQSFWKPGKVIAYGTTTAYWVGVCVTGKAFSEHFQCEYPAMQLKSNDNLFIIILPTND